MSTTNDSAALDPLGEMPARKSIARKHVQHSRAQSNTDSLREVLSKAVAANNRSSISSIPESVSTLNVEQEYPSDKPASVLDKELPPPPSEIPEEKFVEEESVEAREWRAASFPAPVGELQEPVVPLTAESPSPVLRLKKKVPWKGKNIAILLPLDDERGQNGNPPTPMTPTNVEKMLREWEQLGYNVTGFNLGNLDSADTAENQGQSRSVWPDVEAMIEERQTGKYRVNIPDRRMWEAYVEELREAKLRALGVSLGDEDPVSTASPSASAMSRTTSMQYPPLPFSPPIPPSSATSSHAPQHPIMFSPALLPGQGPSTNQSSNVGSVASPASMHAQMYGKLNPRQSISLSTGDNGIGSPFQYGQQSSPGVWSPQQMLYQPGFARGGSPSLQNLGAFISPGSPFQQDGYFPHADLAMQMQHRQQQLQNQLQQQMNQAPSSRQTSRFQEISEHDTSSVVQKSPSKTPEASQFIRHNASDSLQKEIDDAEYHLEEQFQRQLDHEDYSPHSEKEDSLSNLEELSVKSQAPKVVGLDDSRYADNGGPVLHHPQPHSRGHSLSHHPFESHDDIPSPELDKFTKPVNFNTPEEQTNSSSIGTPLLTNDLSGLSHERSFSNSSNPWLDSEPLTSEPDRPARGHESKPSVSKLNVAAPEFKFDPTKAFNPAQFSFGTGFHPAVAAPSFMPPTMSAIHSLHGSIGGVKPPSKINVEAPEFKPGQSEFNFSPSGPTFRPNAPTFTPVRPTTESAGSGQSGTEGSNPRTSIFGKIDMMGFAGIVKPSKNSKAVPIIRPDSAGDSNVAEDDVTESEDGRITQGIGRMKRAKGSRNGGDSVPVFAEPSPEPTLPLQETKRDQSPPKEVLPILSTQADKENTPVEADKNGLRVVPPSAAALSAVKSLRSHSILQDSPDYDGKGWAPWEFDQTHQVEQFNTASAFPVRAPSQPEPKDQDDDIEKAEAIQNANEPSMSTPVEKSKNHKNSLSALAKPFDFSAPSWFKFGSSNSIPKQAPAPATANGGLSSSRYAASPSPPPPPPPAKDELNSPEVPLRMPEKTSFQESLPQPQGLQHYQDEAEVVGDREPTFEEIDAVMRHMNEEPNLSVRRDIDTPGWHQPSPNRQSQTLAEPESSPIRIHAQNLLRSDAPSPSPKRFQPLPGDRVGQRVFSRSHDDPFVGESLMGLAYESPVHNLNPQDGRPTSDWDDVLSQSEEGKFQARTQFFDNHVNNLVGGLLAERLDPLEKALETIQLSLITIAEKTPSTRRMRRSFSGELPESDADDEDDEDEQDQRRSASPRKDGRKWEKMRSIMRETLAAHQPSPVSQSLAPVAKSSAPHNIEESSNILQVLEEMREQFGQSMRLDLRGEDLRNIVEEAVERRMPATPKPMVDEAATAKIAQLEARILELNQKAVSADEKAEQEIKNRRAAEDRLAEVQRLLRISSEEEDRLREALDERDQKLKTIDETRTKSAMRTTLLEANVQNAQKSQSEMANKLGIVENELRQARQDAQHWKIDAEKATEAAKRHNDDAEIANETNGQIRRTIESLKVQMEESLRLRESMRVKLGSLQEEMAQAARGISQENAKRARKEQQLIARQEVLDARLQAEARTRERLEKEIERLESGEREGMRAVSESKRLDTQMSGLQQELHQAQKNSLRYQREFEEARESGLSEVKRTRHHLQAEIEAANNQVNVVRQDLEGQVSRLRTELDNVKLEADTTKAKSEMLLEEIVETKRRELNDAGLKHENEIDDLQTRHERQLGIAIEDHQRSEEQLLERLSLSTASKEHLQDRVAHLEERLEIAKAAAHAAAQAARSASVSSPDAPQKLTTKAIAKTLELPEKISPQALRESIMVLQEQLQDREQTIEKLEQKLSTVDLDAPNKISKRDDEITWLRELLAVRVGDLQDIINTVSNEEFDPTAVKDAAIRLKANLQMEQQERERSMSGTGYLPNIAASIKDAATPRVAQVVGPMAAAWGNWRKLQETGTPSKSSPQSFLSGLLTPPASSVRTPTTQPTAFNSTGRRFTAQQLANRPSRRQEKMPVREGPPTTPPMMRTASYDQDAHAGDFGDAGFYDDDESTADVDDGMFATGR